MKKSFWLALWGWAARWLCHIWVLKYIEQNDINITEIAWTSMWAIIWSFFALWKRHDEIYKIAKEINYIKLIDIDLKKWLVSWKKVYNKLYDFFWDELIENTKIPLKIISTNLETGEKIIFTKWKIIDAIRASISLPMVFSYYELNSTKFLDWWLKSNLPILDLDSKDIIAVSAIRDSGKKINTTNKIWKFFIDKWFFWYNYEILKKTITIMMATNEDLSLKLATLEGKNILLINPDTTNIEYYDFNKIDILVKKAYNEAKTKLKNI